MTLMTGPKLDRMRDQLIEWWLRTRKRLIERLEEGYPYGAVPLTPQEQIERFVSMRPEDWNALTDRLLERHKGEPNQQELVQKELQGYQERMFNLMRRR